MVHSKHTIRKVIWLPLEKIDKRYTKLTRIWFGAEFKKRGITPIVVDGKQLSKNIEVGSFLDVFGTIHYKSEQIRKVSLMFRQGIINDGDVFFIDDVWFPGLHAIKYMAKMSGIDVKICGIYHAGSHTPTDDVATKIGRNNWVKHFERSILEMCDKVFVGSNFHKKEIQSYHNKNFRNIIVTGLCFNSEYVRKIGKPINWKKRKKVVVFPHRIHPEKQLNIFINLKKIVQKKRRDIEFIITHKMNLSKEKFYKLLGRSRLVFSASLQENFGYSILEALSLGCDILVPKRLVYPEFYSGDVFYDENDSLKRIAKKIIEKIDNTNPPQKQEILYWIDDGCKRIIGEVVKMLR